MCLYVYISLGFTSIFFFLYKLLKINFQYETNKDLAKELILSNKYFDDYDVLFPHLLYALKTLWQDSGVREAVARGFEYELNDSAL